MTSKNLLPGQYQIGDLVFGKHTAYPVSKFDPQAYNVNAQDSQRASMLSDETDFGIDTFAAQPIQIELSVLDNYELSAMRDYVGGVSLPGNIDTRGYDRLLALSREWRADETRRNFGAMKPLYYCPKDGVTRVIYGRPGKFYPGPRPGERAVSRTVQAEFRPADTQCYTEQETYVDIDPGAEPIYVVRDKGNQPAWFRIIAEGPITHPVITVGDQQIELDIELEEGEAVECSSYPWRRRIIDSNGRNLSAKLVGDTQYLDRLTIPADSVFPVRWTSDEVSTMVPDLGNQTWYEGIDDLNRHNLPNAFTQISGKVVVQRSLFHGKYLGAAVISKNAAAVYSRRKFNTAYQYAEATLTQNWGGKSALCIMSTETMNQFVCIAVTSGPFNNWLTIRSGTGPLWSQTIERASWQNTDLFGWRDTDKIALKFDPLTTTYTMYFNGVPKGTWIDNSVVIPTAGSNRNMAVTFDMQSELLTIGPGLRNILAYDYYLVPAMTGRLRLMWQDAWSIAA